MPRQPIDVDRTLVQAWLAMALAVTAGCAPSQSAVQEVHPKSNQVSPTSKAEVAVEADADTLWTRSGDDWPDFLGPHRDAKSSETGLNWDWTDNRLPLVWSRPLLGGYGIGSVARGRFFQFDGDGTHAALVCLQAETGKQLWHFEYPLEYKDTYGFDGGPRCSPVVDEDRVYIYGVTGELHCLEARTGELIWSFDANQQFGVVQNFFGVGSTPVVYQDLLIVMVGGSPTETAKQRTHRLDEAQPNGVAIVAIDKRTGVVRYKTINDLASYSSPIVVKLGDRATGLAFCRGGLHAFDPDNGELRWSFPWRARKYESVNASTPVVSDSRVLITESYGPGGVLLDVSGDQPKALWQDETIRRQRLSCHWCTPIVVDGFAYACHGEHPNEAELRCVELTSGDVKWSKKDLGRCNLTYVDDHLICLCDGGRLLAIKANSEGFEVVAEFDPDAAGIRLSGPCYASTIISHGLLYVRDAHKLYCFDIMQK